MVTTVAYDKEYEDKIRKLDTFVKEKIKKQIRKIINDPGVGKPMRYGRKGTRELYVSPFRLSYIYDREKDIVILLDIYHKDKQ